ncbi:MAG: hypothetical protein Q7R22_015130 [Verrucomicrobiota bacterium JB025]|nr:hypothetical protein [Verrucomicrobiota bacterium JB025]
MKKFGSYVVLALGVIVLVMVVLWRVVFVEADEGRYPAVQYFAIIRAVDDSTFDRLDPEVHWDYERVSPFEKGVPPASVAHPGEDRVVISVVGLPLDGGLPVKVGAAGYQSRVVNIIGRSSGLHTGGHEEHVVRLRAIPDVGRSLK